MPADNVTPFRRPPKRPVAPQQQGGFGLKTHRGRAVLSQGLTLAAFAANLLLPGGLWTLLAMAIAIAAALVAMTNRGQGMPWAATHHEHAIRTLIIGYAIWVLATALVYVSQFLALATQFIHLGVAIWAGLRALVGMVLAIMRKPIPHPHGWFV